MGNEPSTPVRDQWGGNAGDGAAYSSAGVHGGREGHGHHQQSQQRSHQQSQMQMHQPQRVDSRIPQTRSSSSYRDESMAYDYGYDATDDDAEVDWAPENEEPRRAGGRQPRRRSLVNSLERIENVHQFNDNGGRHHSTEERLDPLFRAAARAQNARQTKRQKQKARRAQHAPATDTRAMQAQQRSIDNEWKASLHRLASTTASTAKTFSHIAAPVLVDAGSILAQSAKDIGETYHSSTVSSNARNMNGNKSKAEPGGPRGAADTRGSVSLPAAAIPRRAGDDDSKMLSDSFADDETLVLYPYSPAFARTPSRSDGIQQSLSPDASTVQPHNVLLRNESEFQLPSLQSESSDIKLQPRTQPLPTPVLNRRLHVTTATDTLSQTQLAPPAQVSDDETDGSKTGENEDPVEADGDVSTDDSNAKSKDDKVDDGNAGEDEDEDEEDGHTSVTPKHENAVNQLVADDENQPNNNANSDKTDESENDTVGTGEEPQTAKRGEDTRDSNIDAAGGQAEVNVHASDEPDLQPDAIATATEEVASKPDADVTAKPQVNSDEAGIEAAPKPDSDTTSVLNPEKASASKAHTASGADTGAEAEAEAKGTAETISGAIDDSDESPEPNDSPILDENAGADTGDETETNTKSVPNADADSDPEGGLDTKPRSGVDGDAGTDQVAKTAADNNSSSKTDDDVGANTDATAPESPRTEAEGEADDEAEDEAKSASTSDVSANQEETADAKPEPTLGSDAEPDQDAKTEVKNELALDADASELAEATGSPQVEANDEAKSDSKPDTDASTDPGETSEAKPSSGPDSDIEPDKEVRAEADSKSDADTKPAPDEGPETQSRPDAAADEAEAAGKRAIFELEAGVDANAETTEEGTGANIEPANDSVGTSRSGPDTGVDAAADGNSRPEADGDTKSDADTNAESDEGSEPILGGDTGIERRTTAEVEAEDKSTSGAKADEDPVELSETHPSSGVDIGPEAIAETSIESDSNIQTPPGGDVKTKSNSVPHEHGDADTAIDTSAQEAGSLNTDVDAMTMTVTTTEDTSSATIDPVKDPDTQPSADQGKDATIDADIQSDTKVNTTSDSDADADPSEHPEVDAQTNIGAEAEIKTTSDADVDTATGEASEVTPSSVSDDGEDAAAAAAATSDTDTNAEAEAETAPDTDTNTHQGESSEPKLSSPPDEDTGAGADNSQEVAAEEEHSNSDSGSKLKPDEESEAKSSFAQDEDVDVTTDKATLANIEADAQIEPQDETVAKDRANTKSDADGDAGTETQGTAEIDVEQEADTETESEHNSDSDTDPGEVSETKSICSAKVGAAADGEIKAEEDSKSVCDARVASDEDSKTKPDSDIDGGAGAGAGAGVSGPEKEIDKSVDATSPPEIEVDAKSSPDATVDSGEDTQTEAKSDSDEDASSATETDDELESHPDADADYQDDAKHEPRPDEDADADVVVKNAATNAVVMNGEYKDGTTAVASDAGAMKEPTTDAMKSDADANSQDDAETKAGSDVMMETHPSSTTQVEKEEDAKTTSDESGGLHDEQSSMPDETANIDAGTNEEPPADAETTADATSGAPAKSEVDVASKPDPDANAETEAAKRAGACSDQGAEEAAVVDGDAQTEPNKETVDEAVSGPSVEGDKDGDDAYEKGAKAELSSDANAHTQAVTEETSALASGSTAESESRSTTAPNSDAIEDDDAKDRLDAEHEAEIASKSMQDTSREEGANTKPGSDEDARSKDGAKLERGSDAHVDASAGANADNDAAAGEEAKETVDANTDSEIAAATSIGSEEDAKSTSLGDEDGKPQSQGKARDDADTHTAVEADSKVDSIANANAAAEPQAKAEEGTGPVSDENEHKTRAATANADTQSHSDSGQEEDSQSGSDSETESLHGEAKVSNNHLASQNGHGNGHGQKPSNQGSVSSNADFTDSSDFIFLDTNDGLRTPNFRRVSILSNANTLESDFDMLAFSAPRPTRVTDATPQHLRFSPSVLETPMPSTIRTKRRDSVVRWSQLPSVGKLFEADPEDLVEGFDDLQASLEFQMRHSLRALRSHQKLMRSSSTDAAYSDPGTPTRQGQSQQEKQHQEGSLLSRSRAVLGNDLLEASSSIAQSIAAQWNRFSEAIKQDDREGNAVGEDDVFASPPDVFDAETVLSMGSSDDSIKTSPEVPVTDLALDPSTNTAAKHDQMTTSTALETDDSVSSMSWDMVPERHHLAAEDLVDVELKITVKGAAQQAEASQSSSCEISDVIRVSETSSAVSKEGKPSANEESPEDGHEDTGVAQSTGDKDDSNEKKEDGDIEGQAEAQATDESANRAPAKPNGERRDGAKAACGDADEGKEADSMNHENQNADSGDNSIEKKDTDGSPTGSDDAPKVQNGKTSAIPQDKSLSEPTTPAVETTVGWDKDAEAKHPNIPETEEMTDVFAGNVLDTSLLALTSLDDVDFLNKKRPSSAALRKDLTGLARIRWDQLVANWMHAETWKAINAVSADGKAGSEQQGDGDPAEGENASSSNSSTVSTVQTVINEQCNLLLSTTKAGPSQVLQATASLPRSVPQPSMFRPIESMEQYLPLRTLTDIGPLGMPSIAPSSSESSPELLSHEIHGDEDGKGDAKHEVTQLLERAKQQLPDFESLLRSIVRFSSQNESSKTYFEQTATSCTVGLKSEASIRSKADRKYGGDAKQVKDILRGQIVFPDQLSMICALVYLRRRTRARKMKRSKSSASASGSGKMKSDGMTDGKHSEKQVAPIEIVRMKNLFSDQSVDENRALHGALATGYRHVLLTVRLEGGLLAEIQCQLRALYEVLGEEGYALHRKIEGVEIRKGDKPNPSSQQLFSLDAKTLIQSFLPNDDSTNREEQSTRRQQEGSGAGMAASTQENCKPAVSPFAGGGIAAAAAMAAAKKGPPDSKGSSKPKASPFAGGGIAAAAAMAAAKKSNNGDSSDGGNKPKVSPFAGGGIAAAAAMAAAKKSKSEMPTAETKPKASPFAGGGIAAAAAMAAAKKAKPESEKSKPKPSPFAGGGIAAAAAMAAAKKSKPKTSGGDEKAKANPFAGGGIAAAAAMAAAKKSKSDTPNADEKPKVSPFAGGGIAAAAAMAAAKKNKPLPEPEKPKANPFAGGGIAAAAAMAAAKKSKPKTSGGDKRPKVNPFAGGGIAAAAAMAAAKKSKSDAPNAVSQPKASPFAGGGIAAAAAMAAAKKSKPPSEADKPKANPFAGGGIAAAAAMAAAKKSKGTAKSPGEDKPKASPFAGGGIAAAAAMAAAKKSKASGKPSSDAKPAPSPFAGGGIAAAAAMAAAKKGKPLGESSTDRRPGGSPFAGGGIAAAAAMAAAKKAPSAEVRQNGSKQAFNPLAGGGIAAAAAMAASNKQAQTGASTSNVKTTTIAMAKDSETQGGSRGNSDFTANELFESMINIAIGHCIENPRDVSSFLCLASLVECQTNSNQSSPSSESTKQAHSKEGDDESKSDGQPLNFANLLLQQCLDISNQASSNGMLGWLEYGSSNSLERNPELGLQIAHKLAANFASAGQHRTALDILSGLRTHCGLRFPVVHPIAVSITIDLSICAAQAGDTIVGQKLINQVNRDISAYLSQKESSHFDLLRKYVAFRKAFASGCFLETLTDRIAELKSFAALMEAHLGRGFLLTVGDTNPAAIINKAMVGNCWMVVANCVAAGERSPVELIHGLNTARQNTGHPTLRRRESASASSREAGVYWNKAYELYQSAFRSYLVYERGTMTSQAAVFAYNVARCLRELDKRKEAIHLLNMVVSKLETSAGSASHVGKRGHRDRNDGGRELRRGCDHSSVNPDGSKEGRHAQPQIIGVHGMHGAHGVHGTAALMPSGNEEVTALCLWMMAVLSVEDCPDERGRIRALSLLHGASTAVKQAMHQLQSPDGHDGDATGQPSIGDNRRKLQLLYKRIQDEARSLYEPLDVLEANFAGVSGSDGSNDGRSAGHPGTLYDEAIDPTPLDWRDVLTPMRRKRWEDKQRSHHFISPRKRNASDRSSTLRNGRLERRTSSTRLVGPHRQSSSELSVAI